MGPQSATGAGGVEPLPAHPVTSKPINNTKTTFSKFMVFSLQFGLWIGTIAYVLPDFLSVTYFALQRSKTLYGYPEITGLAQGNPESRSWQYIRLCR